MNTLRDEVKVSGSIAIPGYMWARLQEVADADDRSRNQTIERILRAYLATKSAGGSTPPATSDQTLEV